MFLEVTNIFLGKPWFSCFLVSSNFLSINNPYAGAAVMFLNINGKSTIGNQSFLLSKSFVLYPLLLSISGVDLCMRQTFLVLLHL